MSKNKTFTTTLFKLSAVNIALGLTFGTVLSVQAEIIANNGAGVAKAANGTDIIAIKQANDAGISYNTFDKFNVSHTGAAFNNATVGANSVLAGGEIALNTNLNGIAANIIIAQVTAQNNRSLLNGAIEVIGNAADVILANPAGIVCSGCGFINAHNVNLIAGDVNLTNDGKINHYLTSSNGNIAFHDNQLDFYVPSRLNLIATRIAFHADMDLGEQAELNGIVGYNIVNADVKTIESSQRNYNSAFVVNPESTISANKIGIKGNNQSGIALANHGIMTGQTLSLTDFIKINNHGAILGQDSVSISTYDAINNFGKIQAARDISLKTFTLNNGDIYSDKTGTTTSLGQLNVDVGELKNNGSMQSQNAMTLEVSHWLVNYDNLASQSTMKINARETTNRGLIESKDNLTFKGRTLANYHQIVGHSGMDVKIDRTIRNNSKAKITSQGDLSISAKEIYNSNLILSANNLTLNLGGYIGNRGKISSEGELSIIAKEIGNSSTIKAKEEILLKASFISNYRDAIIESQNAITLNTPHLYNRGKINPFI